jgi:hypothetical protein
MAKKRKKLTLANVMAVTKNTPIQEKNEVSKKIKLKDLEKFAKSVRFPLVWKEEIENNIDYPTDLSSFIVEAIKEKMERDKMNTFIG